MLRHRLTGWTVACLSLLAAAVFSSSPAYAALPEVDFDSVPSQVIVRTEDTTVSESWTLVVAEFSAASDYDDFNSQGTPEAITGVFTFYEGDGWDSGNPTYLAITDLTSSRNPWVAFQAISGTDLDPSNVFGGSARAVENPNYQAATQPVKLSDSEREKLALAIADASAASSVTVSVDGTLPVAVDSVGSFDTVSLTVFGGLMLLCLGLFAYSAVMPR